jgi:hypothetical protein
MKSTPRLTTPDLEALLRKAKKAKAKPLAGRMTKLLWLRKRQEARQNLRKQGAKAL